MINTFIQGRPLGGVLCQILTPAILLPPSIGRFRVRCGVGVRIRQSGSDFNERG